MNRLALRCGTRQLAGCCTAVDARDRETHMLFGACNCTPAPSGLSRRGVLCTGGAGFVSALLGTLIGSGRTAQAKTLSGSVPEIDRLNVTIVDDIMVRRNVATQKLDGLTIERAQPDRKSTRLNSSHVS